MYRLMLLSCVIMPLNAVTENAFSVQNKIKSKLRTRLSINKLDQQVCESIKKLNALKHQRSMKEKKLRELQTEYDQMVTDAEEAVNTDAGESADAQVLLNNQ